jgi:NhaP-type Na+/H+ or K+/H+ antiporter
MDIFIIGLSIGFVVGYFVRALLSHLRRRRFLEEHGYNPRLRSR